jgi:hypothetical protein
MRLERDLERVLEDLSDDFPLLRSLVDRRRGGQKRLPLPGRGHDRVPGTLFANLAGEKGDGDGNAVERLSAEPGAAPGVPSTPTGSREPRGERSAGEPGEPPRKEDESHAGRDQPPGGAAAVGMLSTVPGRRRPARYALMVQFESRPGDVELGRLVDSTIWINEAHPAYVRASASRSTGYHLALAIALALAPLAVEAGGEHAFIAQFMAHWGSTSVRRR